MDAEDLVAAVLAEPDRREELLPLLHEAHPIYQGRGEVSVSRLRGWVMAAFESVGLPPSALPAVVETLRTSLDPYAVAAAAKAARGAVAIDPTLSRALATALVTMRGRDDSVSFESLQHDRLPTTTTTTLYEIAATLRQLGSGAHDVHQQLVEVRDTHADTWSGPVVQALDEAIEATARAPRMLGLTEMSPSPYVSPLPPGSPGVGSIRLEDQSGAVTTFDEHFRGRFNVAAFFYTRCGNPAKCSATITRLAAVQARVVDDRIGIAGISYDPGYDIPERLAAYGSARGLRFTDTVRLFRAPAGHSQLREHFDLKVGYAGTIVNHHAIELYLIGPDTDTVHVWSRVEWTVDDVLEVIGRLA
jgi:protein SCO1